MTRVSILIGALLIAASTAEAADPAVPPPVAPAPPARPRQIMTSTALTPDSKDAAKNGADLQEGPKFVAEAKWLLAGYNNNEVIYTVVVTSQDARIIRCVTDVSGTYIDNGKKLTISDRQTTTVFPNQPTQVGNWMDLDRDSGATYAVKCRPA